MIIGRTNEIFFSIYRNFYGSQFMIYLRSKTNVERLRSAFQRVDRNEQSAVLSNLVWKCRAILVPLPGTSDPPISSFFLHAKSTASPRDKSPPNSIPRPECHRYIPLKLIDRSSSWSEPLPDSSTSHAWFEIWRGIEAIFSFFFFFFLAIGSLFQSRTLAEIIFHSTKTSMKFTFSHVSLLKLFFSLRRIWNEQCGWKTRIGWYIFITSVLHCESITRLKSRLKPSVNTCNQ